jgi:hypothetical protein
MKRAVIQEILFNVGAHHSSDDSWSAWVGTGAELFRVDRAGELVLAK